MTYTNHHINTNAIRMLSYESTMPVNDFDLLRCAWRGVAIGRLGKLVTADVGPNPATPGYVHYEVWDIGTQQYWSSKRPTTPEFAGAAIEEMLRPLGLSCAELRWAESGAAPRGFNKKSDVDAMEFVYFLEAGPFLKIGKTSGHPGKRIPELQTGCPYPLRIIAHMEGGIKEERALHSRFAHLRARPDGEWFRYSTELIEFVAGLVGAKV